MNRYRVVRMIHGCEETLGAWAPREYVESFMHHAILMTHILDCGYYTVECEHVEDAIKMIEEACNESH